MRILFVKPLQIKNVLGFKVDFETTIAEDKMKLEYLPKFYKDKYPDWNELDIERKIANLTDNDMDDMIEPSFYDNNLDHVKLVVEDIFKIGETVPMMVLITRCLLHM